MPTLPSPSPRRVPRRGRAAASFAGACTLVLASCHELEPPPPSTAADEPGPFATASFELAFENAEGVYESVVKYPASSAEAPYPIVAVSPGTCSLRQWIDWVGDHLATYGYVVITFTPPQPCAGGPVQFAEGLSDGLDLLETLGADPQSPLHGLVDGAQRAVAGHSLGAIAALIAAARDASIDAVIPLAPGSLDAATMALITAPVQIHSASLDGITPPDQAGLAYDRVTNAEKQLLEIEGGNHVGFNDEGSAADTIGGLLDGHRTIDISDHQQRLARRFLTAWLERYLKGRGAAYDTYLTGAQAEADVAAGLFTDFRYAIDGATYP